MSRKKKPGSKTLPSPTVNLNVIGRHSQADLMRRIGCNPYMAGIPPLEPYLSEAQWITLAQKVFEKDGPAQYFVNMFALLRPLAHVVQDMITSEDVAETLVAAPEINLFDVTAQGFLIMLGFSGMDEFTTFVASLNLAESVLPTANVTIAREGEMWTEASVAGMFCNPIYAGVPPYPALVTEKLWIEAALVAVKKEGVAQFLVNMLYALRVTLREQPF